MCTKQSILYQTFFYTISSSRIVKIFALCYRIYFGYIILDNEVILNLRLHLVRTCQSVAIVRVYVSLLELRK